MRLTRWAAALLLCCSAGASAPLTTGVGRVSEGCAPWDGPALQLALPLAPERTLRLALYPAGSAASPQVYPVGVQSGAGGADAWLGGAGTGEQATAGRVWLDRLVSGKGAAGHFDLKLTGGQRLQGTFAARWFVPTTPEFCG